MYGPHKPVRRCKFCHCCKDDPRCSPTCQVSPNGEHYWEIELDPVSSNKKRPGWWLMLLFTWDLLLVKLNKDEL
jgi:hypothetical protein